MKTCVEAIPLEIWFTVFQYLEAHDLFQAFQNLNSHFDQILGSTQLSLCLRWKKTDGNDEQYSTKSYWSDAVLSRVIYLQPAVQSSSTDLIEFLRWNANKFIRLESLTLKTDSRDALSILCICQALRELHCLKRLVLTCVPFRILFETVFALPSLRICQFVFQGSGESIDNNLLAVHSPIKQLFLTFPGRANYSLINGLLTYTPELRHLEICGSSFSFEPISIFSQPLVNLPATRILKLKLDGGFFAPTCFQYLSTTMPALKQFYLHYVKHLLVENFFDHFTADWWPMIQLIQHVNIYIEGHVPIIDDNDDVEKNLQKYQQSLFYKTHQLNSLSKFQWDETKRGRLVLIKITIVKS